PAVGEPEFGAIVAGIFKERDELGVRGQPARQLEGLDVFGMSGRLVVEAESASLVANRLNPLAVAQPPEEAGFARLVRVTLSIDRGGGVVREGGFELEKDLLWLLPPVAPREQQEGGKGFDAPPAPGPDPAPPPGVDLLPVAPALGDRRAREQAPP